jgi:feruloyl-CoA synthase
MILSGNGIDHALIMLGAFVTGVPVVPVSVAYSLMSQDFDKLKHIFAAVRPGLVYAANGKMFAKALGALDLKGVRLVVGAEPPEGSDAELLSDLLDTAPTQAVERALAGVGPTRSQKFSSPRAPPACPRASSTRIAWCARTRRWSNRPGIS